MPVLKAYVHEAVEVERSGRKVPLKKTAEFDMPEEFAVKLKEMPALKKAFHALTPGRQRGLPALLLIRQTSEDAGGTRGEAYRAHTRGEGLG